MKTKHSLYIDTHGAGYVIQSKATPGPWMAHRIGNPYDQHQVYVESNGKNIVTSCEGEANARLIAAAPMLLEALQNLSEIVDWLSKSGNIKSPIEPHPYGLAVIQAKQDARSAIARATSQS